MSSVIIALAIGILIPFTLMTLLVQETETKIFLSFFTWGSISGVLAVYLNGFGSEILEISRETLRIGYAPVVEEFAKALPLFVLLVVFPAFMKKKEVILAALFSGIGFSVVENYLYMINRINEGAFAIIRTVFTRSISTSIMHGLATGIIGLSFYYISRGFFDEFRSSYVFVLVSYSFAIIFHALYNLYVLYSRLGKTVAVLAVIVLYTVGWLFLEIYYPKLGSSSGADEAVTDGG